MLDAVNSMWTRIAEIWNFFKGIRFLSVLSWTPPWSFAEFLRTLSAFLIKKFPEFSGSGRFLLEFFTEILQNFFPEILPASFVGIAFRVPLLIFSAVCPTFYPQRNFRVNSSGIFSAVSLKWCPSSCSFWHGFWCLRFCTISSGVLYGISLGNPAGTKVLSRISSRVLVFHELFSWKFLPGYLPKVFPVHIASKDRHAISSEDFPVNYSTTFR